jgi:hypothetical protein
VVLHDCNSRYTEAGEGRSQYEAKPGQNLEAQPVKQSTSKTPGGVARQVLEACRTGAVRCLPVWAQLSAL